MKHSHPKNVAVRVTCTVLIDCLLIGGGLLLFALFHHVLPQRFDTDTLVDEQTQTEKKRAFDWNDTPVIPTSDTDPASDISQTSTDISSEASEDSSSVSSETTPPKEPMTKERLIALVSAEKRYVHSPFLARKSEEIGCYLGDNAMICISRQTVREGAAQIVYFAADVYISSATDLGTYVCTDENGRVCDGKIVDAAEKSGAVFAVNTDYFKSRSWGRYVRNGVQYLNEPTQNDICVIYLDGSMEIFRNGSMDEERLAEKGAWQIFTFGPSLFDENGHPYSVDTDMNITSVYNNAYNNTHIYGFRTPNPRTAIGYLEPGHFLLVTVDGRQEGYSAGASLTDLAQIMYDEGCVLAYNLDGGGSSQMYFDGKIINSPAKGRNPSDYLVIADKREEVSHANTEE